MYVAIDIGGTKALVALFDETGNQVQRIKFPTPSDYQFFLKELGDQCQQLEQRPAQVGIGIPSPVDRVNGVIAAAGGNLDWTGATIGRDVSALLGCPVAIENDANLAGLSEAKLVQNQYRTALYITISTGIGGVFVIDGIIDPDTVDAEIGHMIYRQPDGSYASWEDLASGKTIVAKYGQRANEIQDPEIWRAATEPMAMGIMNVCAVLTPQVVIIGGGAGASLPTFKPYLEEWLKKLARPQITVPPINVAQRPEEAVLYGAYELAKQRSGT